MKKQQLTTGPHTPQHNRGSRPQQKQIHDVGTDNNPHYDEVRVTALNIVGAGTTLALNEVGAGAATCKPL